MRALGIETIYQDLALADNLDVGSNIFLGREPMKRLLGLPVIDRARMGAVAREVLERLDIPGGRGVGGLRLARAEELARHLGRHTPAHSRARDAPPAAIRPPPRGLPVRLARALIPLTTVRVEVEALGRTGVGLLIRPGVCERQVTLPIELVVRASCGARLDAA